MVLGYHGIEYHVIRVSWYQVGQLRVKVNHVPNSCANLTSNSPRICASWLQSEIPLWRRDVGII